MVTADAVRAVLMASVPLACWLGLLTIWQLYVVVLLAGVATVFFDVAALGYLPAVVGRDRLVDANSKLGSPDAAASIAGPSVAGLLVQVTAAPVAVALDAASFVPSSVTGCCVRLRWSASARTCSCRSPSSPYRCCSSENSGSPPRPSACSSRSAVSGSSSAR